MSKFIGILKPLFCEDKGFSLGRVSYWVVLFPAIYMWWHGEDIKIHHLYVLGFLLIYNSYKRMDMFTNLIRAWRGTE